MYRLIALSGLCGGFVAAASHQLQVDLTPAYKYSGHEGFEEPIKEESIQPVDTSKIQAPPGLSAVQLGVWNRAIQSLAMLRASDADEAKCCTPKLDDDSKIIKAKQLNHEIWEFHLESRRILKTPNRRTYAATRKEDGLKYAVSYISNCVDMREEIHPAVRDFIFSEAASAPSDSHVVAALAPIYVSPPVVVPKVPTEKTKFLGWTHTKEPNSYSMCHGQGATIRALVQLRGGRHIHEHVAGLIKAKNKPSLVSIMKFGKQMIHILKKLHFLGIIHGGIQNETIMFAHHKQDEYKLGEDLIVLTDFSSARFEPAFRGTTEVYDETIGHLMSELSPFQAMGRRSAYRDDLYRTMEAIADIMSGLQLHKALSEKDITFREGFILKLQGQLFDPAVTIKHWSRAEKKFVDVPLWDKVYEGIDEDPAKEIAGILNTVMLQEVVELKIDEYPSYEKIDEAFDQVIKKLEEIGQV